MHNETTITEGKNTNNKINITCRICKNMTNHEIIKDIHVDGGYGQTYLGDFRAIVDWEENYEIVKCLGCDNITFRKTHSNSEDVEQVGPGEFIPNISETLYPNPEEGRNILPDSQLLPANIQKIYSETIKALNLNLPILVGIGIRAIIETICKENDAIGNNLYKKIDNFVAQNILTPAGAEILHKLRVLGNEAAHEVKPHDAVLLGLALDVIENLMESVYILPHHAQANFN